MARPARVDMRSRKPWVLARRRLFGWKVRLLTGRARSRLGLLSGGVPVGTDLSKVRTAGERVKHLGDDAPQDLGSRTARALPAAQECC